MRQVLTFAKVVTQKPKSFSAGLNMKTLLLVGGVGAAGLLTFLAFEKNNCMKKVGPLVIGAGVLAFIFKDKIFGSGSGGGGGEKQESSFEPTNEMALPTTYNRQAETSQKWEQPLQD